MRILVFCTDAFGGKGGIAQFNRDLLRSVASGPRASHVVVLPRRIEGVQSDLPASLDFRSEAAGNKLRYVAHALRVGLSRDRADLVVCCHINLLPLATLASWRHKAPLVLVMYGIEVWHPHKSGLVRRLLRTVSLFVSISDFTWRRFSEWAGLPQAAHAIVPCCVDLARFAPAPQPAGLRARYGIAPQNKVLLTVARLAGAERYKGIDEVLECLPSLVATNAELRYLIVGEGSDRARLEEKARILGVSEHVIFAGYVAEEEKAAHYHLADAFVLPGRGEGFGIVFLEALACGLPVVGSLLDASREALMNGDLGILVDPRHPASVKDGIVRALATRRRDSQEPALSHFSQPRFAARWRRILEATARSGDKLQDGWGSSMARHQ